MKIGGEKAYDRAREDMQKRKEEAEERRARREAMRVDYQVSGVPLIRQLEEKRTRQKKQKKKPEKKQRKAQKRKLPDAAGRI